MSATNPETTSLKSWERWLYGGLGAMAPLIVIGATTDTVAVFSALTVVVAIAWLVKCIFLFGIGGFVAFLHKSEADTWKCFVIGISAPALITTGLSGTAARINAPAPQASLGVFSSAHAAPSPETVAAGSRIKVVPTSGLAEGVAEQIRRGLFGIDPPLSLVVVSAEASEAAARTVAGEVARYAACPTVTRNFKVADPVIFADQRSGRYVVAVQFADRNQAGAYARMLDRATPSRDAAPAVLFTSTARASQALVSRIPDYPPWDDAMLDGLASAREACLKKEKKG
jgi:hypothetical protein